MTGLPNAWVEASTANGRLRGIRFRGVESYLGVPYGATTAGEGRFAPPRRAPSWAGVRDALAFGDAAPQVDTRLGSANSAQAVHALMYVKGGHPLDGARMSEDCLNLNVWTPSSSDGSRRPVMVWFHGGGFQHGSAGSALYNGDQLAQLGDVVVVTVNARLGITGFLPLDQLDPAFSGAGNAGMLDLVAALEWVRENIEAFGGDPGNVTVFGQSGGGGKVNTLLTMPSARGLFHKAINMSGPILRHVEPDQAAGVARRVLAEAGIGRGELHRLRDVPLTDLLELQRRITGHLGTAFGMGDAPSPGLGMGWAPVLDGVHVTEHPFGGRPASGAELIPLLVGFTSHDPALLMAGSAEFADLGAKRAGQLARANFGERGVSLLESMDTAFPDEPVRLRYARVVGEHTFAGAAMEIARQAARREAPVFLYEFAQTTDVLGGLLGACHSLDLPYAFANADRSVFTGTDPHRLATARNMALAWAAFARTGSPQHSEIPAWPSYGADAPARMRIGPSWKLVETPVPAPAAH